MEAAYDPIARALHWGNAILATLAIALAYGISGAPRHSAARELLLTLHGSAGIAILATMLAWAGWRLRHRAPPRWPLLTRLEIVLAQATQTVLFLLFIAMPISGYTILAAAGRPVSFFGAVAIPPLVPPSERLAEIALALHLTGEFLIYGFLMLHVAAALMHAFVRRDGVFERMMPPRG